MEGYFSDFSYIEGRAKGPQIGQEATNEGNMGKSLSLTEVAKKPKCMMCMILKTVTHFLVLIR